MKEMTRAQPQGRRWRTPLQVSAHNPSHTFSKEQLAERRCDDVRNKGGGGGLRYRLIGRLVKAFAAVKICDVLQVITNGRDSKDYSGKISKPKSLLITIK